MWTDDGIAFRLPEADATPPDRADRCSTADELERPGVDAARASSRCSPRASARTRRGRCCCRAAVPASARRCGSSGAAPTCCRWRPSTRLVPDPARDLPRVLPDVFDCPRCTSCCATIGRATCAWSRSIARPSPFARSCCSTTSRLMYEGDAPLAERRAAGADARPRAAGGVAGRRGPARAARRRGDRRGRAGAAANGRALTADELHDLLRRPGDLPRGRAQRCRRAQAAPRAPCHRGAPRRPAAADRGRGRGVVPRRRRRGRSRPGCRRPSSEPVPDALRRLVLRHARGHGPFTAAELREAAGGGCRRPPCSSWPARAP